MIKRILAMTLGLVMLASTAVLAADLRFSWTPNDSAEEVSNYRMYYSTTSGMFNEFVDVGLPEIIDGKMYYSYDDAPDGMLLYFALTAVNEAGESGMTPEVMVDTNFVIEEPLEIPSIPSWFKSWIRTFIR